MLAGYLLFLIFTQEVVKCEATETSKARKGGSCLVFRFRAPDYGDEDQAEERADGRMASAVQQRQDGRDVRVKMGDGE